MELSQLYMEFLEIQIWFWQHKFLKGNSKNSNIDKNLVYLKITYIIVIIPFIFKRKIVTIGLKNSLIEAPLSREPDHIERLGISDPATTKVVRILVTTLQNYILHSKISAEKRSISQQLLNLHSIRKDFFL